MIETQRWLRRFTDSLMDEFGARLLFLGLQGSYGRGEATEQSDLDIVTILDHLDLTDLDAYRRRIAEMPYSQKACGFICGLDVLRCWPRHELFQFAQETHPFYRELTPLLPPVSQEDITASIRIEAGNLHHRLCHLYLYAPLEDRAQALHGAYKSAFFLLQMLCYRRTGRYLRTKREMLPQLSGEEECILTFSMRWEEMAEDRRRNPQPFFQLLLDWTQQILMTT